MRPDAGPDRYDASTPKRFIELLRELCAREGLSPAETEAVINKATARVRRLGS
jgi:hypothetical protein